MLQKRLDTCWNSNWNVPKDGTKFWPCMLLFIVKLLNCLGPISLENLKWHRILRRGAILLLSSTPRGLFFLQAQIIIGYRWKTKIVPSTDVSENSLHLLWYLAPNKKGQNSFFHKAIISQHMFPSSDITPLWISFTALGENPPHLESYGLKHCKSH